MSETPEQRLAAMGLELPPPIPELASYVGAVTVANTVFVAGHGPWKNGEFIYLGKLGRDLDVAAGQDAARLVALNLLSTLKAEIGSLERVRRAVKLLVMVNSEPDFIQQPQVANGASDLLIEVFGTERGRHARSAVSTVSLPLGFSVEIEGIFEIEPAA
jgi:enamine deaminase RidA (YjgF/YER057c/UK114 family)